MRHTPVRSRSGTFGARHVLSRTRSRQPLRGRCLVLSFVGSGPPGIHYRRAGIARRRPPAGSTRGCRVTAASRRSCSGMTERAERLAGYRHRRDHFFAEHPHSPLAESERTRFTGLDYYPERADLAMTLKLADTGPGLGDVIDVPTTDGKIKQ